MQKALYGIFIAGKILILNFLKSLLKIITLLLITIPIFLFVY